MKVLVNSTDIPAANGVVWTSWPGAGQVYASPVHGMGIVGMQRAGVNQWALDSNLVASDQVYSDTPNPATPSTNWWPVSTVPFATATSTGTATSTATSTGTGTGVVPAGNIAKLSWVNPTQNTDGTPLTNSAGSDIYQGTSTASLVKVASVGPGVSQWQSPPLAAGTYFWAVSDFNSATPSQESAKSGIVSAVIKVTPPPIAIPGVPTALTISVTVTATAP